MKIFDWLRRPVRRPFQRSYSPCLELLEDRLLLSNGAVPALLLLDPSSSGALNVTGNGSVVVSGGGSVVVDSAHSQAAKASGNGRVSAGDLYFAGTPGYASTGNARFHGLVHSGATPLVDPLVNLPVPQVPATTFGAVSISGNTSRTLSPGTYVGGIKVSGNASVTLLPGLYFLKSGGFAVSGNGNVTGTGVLLYNDAHAARDVISLSGNGNVRLTPAATGIYQNVTVFQNRASTAPLTVSGSGNVSIVGAIYAAHATLNGSGNGMIAPATPGAINQIIVAQLNVSGNGVIRLGADFNTPLTVTASIAPAPVLLPDGSPATNVKQSIVAGRTGPGATVNLEADGDGLFDEGLTTADANGNYSFAVALAEGPNVLQVRAKSRFDQEAFAAVDVALDTIAPMVVIAAPTPDLVTNHNFTVSGVTTDDRTGVAALQAALDDGSYAPITFDAAGAFSFATNLPVDQSADGVHTVHLRAIDRVGNVSSVRNVNFTLDTVAPTITGSRAPAPNADGWNNTDIVVSFSASDSLSGVASLTASVTLSDEDAGQAVTGIAIDVAGNSASTVVSGINIDKTKPATAASLSGVVGLSGWYQGPVTVSLDATDNLAGVRTIYYVLDNGSTQTYAAPFAVSGDAVHTLTYWSVDKADNEETHHSQTIQIDTQAPTFTGSRAPAPNADGWNNTNVVVTFSASDNLSGVAFLTSPVTLSGEGANQNVTGSATDVAGNTSSTVVSGINIDKTKPATSASLSGLVGNAGWYRSDVTVSLNATDNLAGVRTTYYVLDGRSTQAYSVPVVVNGDAVHTLSYWSVDKADNEETHFSQTIQIDTQPPTIASTSPTLGLLTDVNPTVAGQVSDARSGVAALQAAVDGGSFFDVFLDSSGNYSFVTTLALDGSADGYHTVDLRATDQAGNISGLTDVPFTLQAGVTLTEGNSFDVTLRQTVTIPQQASVLKFNFFGPAFDTGSQGRAKDAFEVALVDSLGVSLVPTFAANRDAFFNVGEGRPAVLGAWATTTGQTVTLDLTHVTPGTLATVVFRLVNNDADVNTSVRVADIHVAALSGPPADPGGQPSAAPASIAAAVDFAHLADVTASFQPVYSRTSFDEGTKVFYADLATRNVGQYPAAAPLLVAIDHLSDPTVHVRGADGLTPGGLPYFDFTNLVAGNGLPSGATTGSRTLSFYNPGGGQFTYDLIFLGELNRDPQITTTPDVEALVGKPYQYDVNATDPEGDAVTFSLVIAPTGMTIDGPTGVISYSPQAGNVGNHSVIVRAEDGHGGSTQQAYTLSVIQSPPNRPPVFTSAPVVAANVGTAYAYQATATDPDSDPLTFSVAAGPQGMTIDPASGLVQWTPDGASGSQQYVVSDTRFDPANWSAVKLTDNTPAPGQSSLTGSQIESGGNPSSYRTVVESLAGPGSATYANLFVPGVYAPRQSGAISTLELSFDVKQGAAYQTGLGPTNIVAGDLNGDGNLDLVTTDNGASSISVLLGQGRGVYSARTDYAVNAGPWAIALGDFNEDGRLDVVVTNRGTITIGTTVSVLLGKGDGTLFPRTDFTIGRGSQGVAVGDLNRDGHIDIVVTDRDDSDVSVLLGRGDGTFAPHTTFSTAFAPSGVALGDLNSDGRLDIVTANFAGARSVSVLLGNGDGTFAQRTDYVTPVSNDSVALKDLNGDGALDLVVANIGASGESPANTVSVFLGRGDGTFGPRSGYLVAGRPASLAVADVNKDGYFDVVTANRELTTDFNSTPTNSVSVLLGRGDGTFAPRTDFRIAGISIGLVLQDLDRDGNLDIAATLSDHSNVSLLLGHGDGTFDTEGTAFQPVLLQAGWYYSTTKGSFAADGAWKHYSVSNLASSDFTLVSGPGPLHPDFSATAAPLQFGYSMTSTTTSGPLQAFGAGVDNWSATITSVPGGLPREVPVALNVSDGRGGTATQTYAVHLDDAVGNHPPVIVTDPVTTAMAGLPYSYNVDAIDPDDDLLTYYLDLAPEGMSINAATGVLGWQVPADNPTYGFTKTMGSSARDEGRGVATDSLGNVYLTGYVSGTVDFDPGPGVVNLSPAAQTRAYVAKYSPAGSLIWLKSIQGTGNSSANAIAVDQENNVYVAGNFSLISGNADFDPGPGQFVIPDPGSGAAFVWKLDADGNFLWARATGGTPSVIAGLGLALDPLGNVALIGNFYGNIDVDPSAGVLTFTSVDRKPNDGGSNPGLDLFALKLAADGTFLWARHLGDASGFVEAESSRNIAMDDSGNVLISGRFFFTIDFDPGPGSTLLTSKGFDDIFVLKLDAGGNFIWVRQIGAPGAERGRGIDVDSSGNVALTSIYDVLNGVLVDYDPGPGVALLPDLTPNYNAGVVKLDANGNFLWTVAFPGGGGDAAYGLAFDSTGNVIAQGSFTDTRDFDPGPGVINLNGGEFTWYTVKLDPHGHLIWVQPSGGYQMAVDCWGHIYSTGYFQDAYDFDPGPATNLVTSTAGSIDIFLTEITAAPSCPTVSVRVDDGRGGSDTQSFMIDVSGNLPPEIVSTPVTTAFSGVPFTYDVDAIDPDQDPLSYSLAKSPQGMTIDATTGVISWPIPPSDSQFAFAFQAGSLGDDYGFDVVADDSGNSYMTGFFTGTVDFDPGEGVANLTSAGGSDVFVAKYGPTGSFLWAKRAGGSSSSGGRQNNTTDVGYGIALDGKGNVYVAGEFLDTADFDPGVGVSNLTSAGGLDAFLWKLNTDGNLIWARRMGGTAGDEALDLSLDAQGNIHLIGYFQGTVDFDPGPGTQQLTSFGSRDLFVLKLDPDGHFLWSGQVGGANGGFAFGNAPSLAVDPQGNVVISATFTGTVDANPGPGFRSVSAAGFNDILVAQWDQDGNHVWSHGIGASSFDGEGRIAVDLSGNVLLSGWFLGAVDFDPGPGLHVINNTTGDYDAFVLKLTASGQFSWVNRVGNNVFGENSSTITVDHQGDIYAVITTSQGATDFDPGPGVFNLTAPQDGTSVLWKLSSQGSLIWAKGIAGGGQGSGYPQGLYVDCDGGIFYAGLFSGKADFDPGLATANLTSAGQVDAFLAKLTQPPPCPDVTVRVDDGRGGSDTQSFVINVSNAAPAEIRGAKFNDLNGNGGRTQLVYSNNFENSADPLPGWSTSTLATTPSGRHFLGEFNNGTVSLTLGNLPTHTKLEITFDLFILKSWDGNATPYGPDVWDLSVVGGPTLLHTTFTDDPDTSAAGTHQAYPDPFPGGDHYARTGATESNTLGYGNDVVYHLDYTFPHSADLVTINFSAVGLQSINDESWGLDNVQVKMVEPGIQGWTIYLDDNRNNRRDPSERFTTTDGNGNYSFPNLAPGTYVVTEEQQPGWVQTAPSGGTHTITVASGQIVTGKDFGNKQSTEPPVNHPPTITSAPLTAATVGQLFRYNAAAVDPDSDTLTFDLPVHPVGMAVDPSTGILIWIPTADQQGAQDVTLRVQDGHGGVALQSFQVAANRANSTPIITSTPRGPAIAGTPWQYQVQAQDADGDPISYQIEAAPSGMTINVATGLISWTPVSNQVGSQHVALTASDNFGASTTQSFDLPVVASAANSPPSISSTPRANVRIGDTYLYQVLASDPNSDPLTYSLPTNPTGMTIDASGAIVWVPSAAQFGSNSVQIRVEDGRGGFATQSFTINVGSQFSNHSPSITSTPTFTATVGRSYAYNLTGTDPDGDPLRWSLDVAPTGMSIDPALGTLRWTPVINQLGTQNVVIRLVDGQGGFATQSYAITVRAVNVPPVISSTPPTTGVLNQVYSYAVLATDVDNDPLTFSLTTAPTGMTIGAQSGLIQWSPTSIQLGSQNVALRVDDGQGGFATQTYTVVVSATAPNHPPVITSTPEFVATVGTAYQYTITATDPDGQAILYSLLSSPAGMSIIPNTGLVTWTPSPGQEGLQQVTVAAIDSVGASGTQTYTIAVTSDNKAPTITSSPIQVVTAGLPYRYDVRASDPDGDPLTFTLGQHPTSLTLDSFGRLTWAPAIADIGIHRVEITVADNRGAAITQFYDLVVLADQQTPRISLFVSGNPVNVGTPVTFVVSATDNVGVVSRNLTINGNQVPLDSNGRITLIAQPAGDYAIFATATDAAGNVGSASTTLSVIDTSDVEAPIVDVTSPTDGAVISAPVDVIGTASDANLLYYTLLVAPMGSTSFTEMFRGTTSVTDGVLGKFDPTGLANDTYTLRLSATDADGNVSSIDTIVNVAGDLKIGNFTLSFTDMAIPVAGIPVMLTRTYDTLTSAMQDDLGFGWRLEFRDTDLRTSLEPSGVEDIGIYTPFRDGARVYLTVPGGRREGFTFHAVAAAGFAGGFGFSNASFVPDAGVTSSLTLPQNYTLIRNSFGEYYGLVGGGTLAFNPVDNLNFGGQYILTTKDGLAYTVDAVSGDLLRVADTHANTLSFTDAAITSSAGPRITFERDPQGRIIAAVDPTGQKVRYQYDATGDLVAVTDREGNVTHFVYNEPNRPHYLTEVIDPLGRTGVRTEYDSQGRLIKLIDAGGNPVQLAHDPDHSIETVTDALGHATAFEYDLRGNVVTEVNALGGITRRTYDGANNMLSETDPLGKTTAFTYDSLGNLLTQTDPLGNVTRNTYFTTSPGLFASIRGARPVSFLATTTDPLGNTSTNGYDGDGNLLTSTDAAGNITHYAYDGAGNQTSITDAAGNVTRFDYDGRGNLLHQIDAFGNITAFTYDGNGNQLTQSITVTGPGGPRLLTTTSAYDANGHPIAVTDALGNTSRTEYDALGHQIAAIDALGHRTEFTFDLRGQLEKTTFTDGAFTTTSYDAAGKRIASTDRAGRETRFQYDALGRLVATIYPDGTSANPNDNPRTGTEYDAASRVIAQIDELGHRTEFDYDANGRQILVRNALGQTTLASYGAAGRTVSSTDALGHATRFVYDALGRQTQVLFVDATSTSKSYDALGRGIAEFDQSGRATHFEYDALGRLTAVVDALNQRTEYGYDEAGNLNTQTDANSRVTRYEYDGLGRRVATVLPLGQRSASTFDAAGNLATATDFNGATIRYEYDANNRLVAKRFPDNTGVTFTYTATGQHATETDAHGVTQYAYDERGRLLSRTDPDGATISYTYDAAGNLVRTDLPNGTFETREYDDLNRLTFLENQGPSGVIASYAYTLAPTGRRDAVVEESGRRVDYLYDGLDRLTREKIIDAVFGNRQIDYAYDPVGNRLSKTDTADGLTDYDYDANDRLLFESLAGAQTDYAYDNNGNTLSKVTSPTDQAFYDWNIENRLVAADVTDSAGSRHIDYRYNSGGIRVASTVAGVETRFLIDAVQAYPQVLLEYRPGGLITVSFVYGNDLISQDRAGVKSYYHVDGLGSTRALTNATGVVTDRYVYDAFGRTIAQSGSTVNLYLFAGEQRDANVGLDYLRARYLSVGTGRFFGRDSFPGVLRSPLTRHPYLYANLDPLDFIDPSGLYSIVEGVASATLIENLSQMQLQPTFHIASRLAIISDPLDYMAIRTDTPSYWKAPRSRGPHQGWDLKASEGTPIYAISSGVITNLRFDFPRSSYGNQIVLAFKWKTGRTLYAFYAHLSDIYVSQNQSVRRGEVLGRTGRTGYGPGTVDHLHFEMRTINSPPAFSGLQWRIDPAVVLGHPEFNNP